MVDMKEKLVELIRNAHKKCKAKKTCPECEQYGNGSDCVYRFIADELLANGVTVQEWIPVTERLPSEGEWLSSEACSFLCKVLIPIPGGSADNKQQVIGYDRLHRRWACEDMIVTHWRPLPKGE